MTAKDLDDIRLIDRTFMKAALAFGRRHLGETGTNPAVGALVVRDGVIIGRGATQPGGRPHAEPLALAEAGEAAKGATLYVTLEPCSHHGKTPPCAEAVIASGVARVVSAMEDPNPRVAGAGHALLTKAGVAVEVGVRAKEACRAHRGHIMRVIEGRPMVTLKLAQTADGFVAGDGHDPRLRITGAAADHRVHMMRALHDAIMVGVGTILADDALLTVRLPGMEARRPLRVILDPKARLPLSSRLVSTARDWPTLAIAGEAAAEAQVRALEGAGVKVVRAPVLAEGKLDLRAVMNLLGQEGLSRVFCEGGPTLASALLLSALADEFILFQSQKPLGRPGVPSLTPAARAIVSDAALWRPVDQGIAGGDQWDSFERVGACLQDLSPTLAS